MMNSGNVLCLAGVAATLSAVLSGSIHGSVPVKLMHSPNVAGSSVQVAFRLRGGADEADAPADDKEADAPISNATYAEMMANFGVSKDYLAKVKGDEDLKQKIRSKFIAGSREPMWKQALMEKEINGSYRAWLPVQASALPYEQPTGLWRPGMDPNAASVQHSGWMVDSHSEAAASGYAPHNYKHYEPINGVANKWPQVWGRFVRDRDERIALRGGDEEVDSYVTMDDTLEYILDPFPELSPSQKKELEAIAEQIARRGRGILAADESVATIGKRLVKSGLENTEETRRRYREILFAHPSLGDYLSGVILHEETLSQADSTNTPFVDVLTSKGILPGVKVDRGLSPIPGSPSESWSKGLGDLFHRCRGYRAAGARFAKWRAVVRIDGGGGLPTAGAVRRNARELAAYARIAQAAGLVPIVEPEVLIEGDHTMQRFAEVSEYVLAEVYREVAAAGVHLEGSLLKPQMMMPGVDAPPENRPTPEAMAEATLRVLRRRVPPAVPGIVFLSGGQSEVEATRNLALINRMADAAGPGPSGRSRFPWTLSFSFGRSLQASVLKVWGGSKKPEDIDKAIDMAGALAKANSEAQMGKFEEGKHPSISESSSLHETNRGWGAAPPA